LSCGEKSDYGGSFRELHLLFGGRVLTLLQFLNRKIKEDEWNSQDQSEHSEPFFKETTFWSHPVFSFVPNILHFAKNI
jgi:hypothetical protein